MAGHQTKSSFAQCNCRWCGKRAFGDCPATDEMRYALKVFARANGRTWKQSLLAAWENGGGGLSVLTQPLMALRNIIGPRGLAKIPTRILERVGP